LPLAVRKRRVDRAAADAGHRMRPGLPGGRIGIGADVGLGGEVADGVVGEGLDSTCFGDPRRPARCGAERAMPAQIFSNLIFEATFLRPWLRAHRTCKWTVKDVAMVFLNLHAGGDE